MFGFNAWQIKTLKNKLAQKEYTTDYLRKRLTARRNEIFRLSEQLKTLSEKYIDATSRLTKALDSNSSQQEENAALQTFVDEVAAENKLLHLVIKILLTDLS